MTSELSVSVGGIMGGGTYGQTWTGDYWPYAPMTAPYVTWPTQWIYPTPPSEPATCIGKAHVFECDHVPACQCGKIQRVMPKAKK